MDDMLAKKIKKIDYAKRNDKICIGTIMSIGEDGRVMVDFPGNQKGAVPAYYTNAFKSQLDGPDQLIHQRVLLLFDEEELDQPVIVDTLHSRVDAVPDTQNEVVKDVTVDGKSVTLDAKEEILLRCGKSSIHLTKAGKIIIRGAYLLNRSSGVNRIKGGSVQIN